MDRIKKILERLIESRWAIFIIGAAIVIINIFLFLPTVFSLRKSVSETEKANVKIVLSQVNSFLEDKKIDIGVPARYLRENLDDKENKLILQKILKESYFTAVSLIDINGNEILKYNKFKTVLQDDMRNVMSIAVFREVLSKKDISWSKIVLSEKFEPSITINVPVFSSSDKLIAVLSATFNINSMFESISNTEFPNNAKVYVVDQTGVLISAPDLSFVLKGTDYSDRKIVKDTLLSTSGVISSDDNTYVYKNEDGVEVLAVGGKVKETGWAIVVEESKSLALKNITRLITSSLIAFFLVVFLIALIRKINARVMEARADLGKHLLRQKELLKEVEKSKKDIEEVNVSLLEKDQKLAEKVNELENFQKFVVGRELRMVELKREIEALKNR